MTSQSVEPTYESHSIDYFGNLSQLLRDLRGITILAHELIQNADDAKDESGRLAAKEFVFEIRDDALYVSNDAIFRSEDFNRIKLVSSGTKRDEVGARTTGAFGVGFMSVLQVTDHPEIYSAGQHWILYPENPEERRFLKYPDNSVKGTLFRLPWAFENSPIRQKLHAHPIARDDLDSFAKEAESVLPQSALFLQSLERLELRRNGKDLKSIRRVKNGNRVRIESDSTLQNWTIFEGRFTDEANALRREYGPLIKPGMDDRVRIGISDFQLESGLLFVTLPTEQSTGLPFHINADFFPYSNRRFVALDSGYESKWNRAVINAASRLVGQSLEEIRKLFEQHPANFWFLIGQIYHVYQTQKDSKQPFGQFWLEVQDKLKSGTTVFTESGKWLRPAEVKIPTGDEEENAVLVFSELGIEIVHHEIRRYRNILTNSGVQTIKARDINDVLRMHKMVAQPLSVAALPKGLQSSEARSLLWKGINAVLENARGQNEQMEARKILSECALAPGLDGRFWPCRAVYKADEQTHNLFSGLLLKASFLSETKVLLFDKLCPEFSASLAVEELTRLDAVIFEAAFRQGRLDSSILLQWFDGKKSEFIGDKNLRDKLANLPIFPSGGKFHQLRGLWLPGGFDNPLGLTDLVDTSKLKGLSDFVRFLGAKELTFTDYAKSYIPQAFSAESLETAQTKQEIIALLTRHIGEIKDDPHVKAVLITSNIVECTDGIFRQPSKVYMPRPEVREILGNFVYYARLTENSEGLADLYQWLGVADQPRVEDILRIMEQVRTKPPIQGSRLLVAKVVEALGRMWDRLPDATKNRYQVMKTIPWLPAEGDQSTWYRPSDLYASYNKTLFESQARFIDIPVRAQQQIAAVFQFLGVNLSPKPYQVVAHLLKCSADDVDPPQGIYLWLNNNVAQLGVLAQLKDKPCLRIQSKYYCPDQVFWGQHRFGRFRIALGPELQQYGKLLATLGIRQNPNHTDAIKVLEEIAKEVGNSPLQPEDEDIVMSCWIMINDALQHEEAAGDDLCTGLNEIKCVPNHHNILYRPSWIFFEDRPGLAEKFPELLSDNTIARPERAWQAMAAAGVKPISEVVTGEIVETANPLEDGWLRQRIMERSSQIKRVIESISTGTRDDEAILLKEIRFFQADDVKIAWHLSAFNRKQVSLPETVSAHLHRSDKLIYFKLNEEDYPWLDLARELAQAIAPGERVIPVSFGIKAVLEAVDKSSAERQLDGLGIARIQELTPLRDSANVVIQSFDESPASGELHEEMTLSQEEAIISSGEEQVHQEEEVNQASADELKSSETASQVNEGVPFAQRLYEAQTVTPSGATDIHILLPEGGPRTEESARIHTNQSVQFGRQGTITPKIVMHWEPRRAAKALENEFKRMVHGDYGKRCQICSRTFKTRSGEPQAFVVHIVQPSADSRTNHFGDLVGLCAWHSELVQHGQWAWIDHETGETMQSWERLQALLLNAPQRTDESGNIYVGLLMRFWNVYQDRGPEPKTIDEEIRYSIPHWKYLRELLRAKEE